MSCFGFCSILLRRAASIAAGLALAACGSTAVDSSDSTTTTAGTGGSSHTSTGTITHAISSTGSNGTGGRTSASVGATSSSGMVDASSATAGVGGAGGATMNVSVGAGGAGGDACDGAYVNVTLQDMTFTLDASCPNSFGSQSTYPVAYEGYTGGTPGSMHELFLEACGPMGTRFAVQVPLFMPGTSNSDHAEFEEHTYLLQTMNGLTLTITAIGPQGGAVTGSYAGTLVDPGGAPYPVSGDFKLCRIGDFLPP